MARHLTLQEREMVSQMHHAGSKQVEIARRLDRHPSTISRELRRNRSRNGYWAVAAQTKAETRRSGRPWVCKLDRPEVSRYVRERLRQYWSPDQIAGRSRSDFPDDPRRHVSRPTIYAWIHAQHAVGGNWRRYLRRSGRVRRSPENRRQLPACVSIEGASGGGRPPGSMRRLGRRHDSRCGASWRSHHAGGAEIGIPVVGQGLRSASDDGSSGHNAVVPAVAFEAAKNIDPGQRQGVCGTRTACGGGCFARVLCQALLCLAAWDQREYQRLGAAILPQAKRPGRHTRATV